MLRRPGRSSLRSLPRVSRCRLRGGVLRWRAGRAWPHRRGTVSGAVPPLSMLQARSISGEPAGSDSSVSGLPNARSMQACASNTSRESSAFETPRQVCASLRSSQSSIITTMSSRRSNASFIDGGSRSRVRCGDCRIARLSTRSAPIRLRISRRGRSGNTRTRTSRVTATPAQTPP